MNLRILAFVLCLLIAPAAVAETAIAEADEQAQKYFDVSLNNFAHTMARFNAIDIKDDALLDEYAEITDCSLVENFYENDFRWSQVRQMIRESIRLNSASFPTGYHYDTKLQLDRYDFKSRNFRFTDRSMIQNVNNFSFTFTMRGAARCADKDLLLLPTNYNIVIGTPVSLGGIPLSEADAKILLDLLTKTGNTDRIIYARFNVTILYIEPLHRNPYSTVSKSYIQNGVAAGQPMRMDARLDSVEFFIDEAMTKKIYTYTP